MKDKHPELMHLTPKQLQNELLKRYPKAQPLVRTAIYNVVIAQQKRRANSGRKVAQVHRWWAPLMYPAQAERRNARAGMDYEPDNEARQEAMHAYHAVIQKAINKIKQYKAQGLTPNGVQERRIKEKKPPYPNDLTHWSDLVPEHIKQAIREAFAELPRKTKAKQKIPFKRD